MDMVWEEPKFPTALKETLPLQSTLLSAQIKSFSTLKKRSPNSTKFSVKWTMKLKSKSFESRF